MTHVYLMYEFDTYLINNLKYFILYESIFDNVNLPLNLVLAVIILNVLHDISLIEIYNNLFIHTL